MRKLYDEEVAHELGYQKYWPEWHDWIIVTTGVLFFTGSLFCLLYWIFV